LRYENPNGYGFEAHFRLKVAGEVLRETGETGEVLERRLALPATAESGRITSVAAYVLFFKRYILSLLLYHSKDPTHRSAVAFIDTSEDRRVDPLLSLPPVSGGIIRRQKESFKVHPHFRRFGR
jgi:hypothetical protein